MRVRVKMCTNKITEEFTKMTKGGKRNVTIFVIVVVHSFKCQLVAYIASHVQAYIASHVQCFVCFAKVTSNFRKKRIESMNFIPISSTFLEKLMYISFGFKYTAELTFVKQPQLHHEDMYSLKM